MRKIEIENENGTKILEYYFTSIVIPSWKDSFCSVSYITVFCEFELNLADFLLNINGEIRVVICFLDLIRKNITSF